MMHHEWNKISGQTWTHGEWLFWEAIYRDWSQISDENGKRELQGAREANPWLDDIASIIGAEMARMDERIDEARNKTANYAALEKRANEAESRAQATSLRMTKYRRQLARLAKKHRIIKQHNRDLFTRNNQLREEWDKARKETGEALIDRHSTAADLHDARHKITELKAEIYDLKSELEEVHRFYREKQEQQTA